MEGSARLGLLPIASFALGSCAGIARQKHTHLLRERHGALVALLLFAPVCSVDGMRPPVVLTGVEEKLLRCLAVPQAFLPSCDRCSKRSGCLS